MPQHPAIVRADSTHSDFVRLVSRLDADLAIRDGDDHAFYSQFNKIDKIKHVVLQPAPQLCAQLSQSLKVFERR